LITSIKVARFAKASHSPFLIRKFSMRNLDFTEISYVSGAGLSLNCVSVETWEKVQNKALKDATLATVIASVIVGAAVYGATAAAGPSVLGVVLLAPYIAGYTYFNSSAWNMVYK
jgi:hypothetical protein